MTLVSITIGAAKDRHYSPADPPHTKKSILHKKSRSPAAPTEREQATGYLGFIILRFTDAMLINDNAVVLHNKSRSPAAPTEREQATGYLGFIIHTNARYQRCRSRNGAKHLHRLLGEVAGQATPRVKATAGRNPQLRREAA